MAFSLLIVLALCGEGKAALTFYFEVGGISLGNVFPTQFYNVSSDVGLGITYMEHDKYIPGNVLHLLDSELRTLNLETNESWLIAGNKIGGYREGSGAYAIFNSPFSFHQLNESVVVVSDGNNHCFRTVSRETNTTSHLAGQCMHPGNSDGPFALARFNMSERILALSQTELLVTDTPNMCIRKLDLISETVTTWKRINHTITIIDITYRPGHTDIYISFSGGFGKIDRDTKEFTFLTQHIYEGFRDGFMSSQAVLSGRPETILFLNENIMLIADAKNEMLRVANFETQIVSSICNYPSDNTTRSGDITVCRLGLTRSLLLLQGMNRLLIGQRDSLGYMELAGISNSSYSSTLPTRSNESSVSITTGRTTQNHNAPRPMTTKHHKPPTAKPTDPEHDVTESAPDRNTVKTIYVTKAPEPAASADPDNNLGDTIHNYHISGSSTASTAGVVVAGILVLAMMVLGYLMYKRRYPTMKSEAPLVRTDESRTAGASNGRTDEATNSSLERAQEGPNMMRMKSLPRRPDATAAPENEYGQVTPQGGVSGEGHATNSSLERAQEGPNMMRMKSFPRRPDATAAPENEYGQVTPQGGVNGEGHARVGRYNRFENESA